MQENHNFYRKVKYLVWYALFLLCSKKKTKNTIKRSLGRREMIGTICIQRWFSWSLRDRGLGDSRVERQETWFIFLNRGRRTTFEIELSHSLLCSVFIYRSWLILVCSYFISFRTIIVDFSFRISINITYWWNCESFENTYKHWWKYD